MYLSLFVKVLRVRGSWRLNKECSILTSPALPDIAVCRSRSPRPLNRGPGDPASLGHVLIPASSHQLVSKLTGGSQRLLLPGGGFLYHIIFDYSNLQLTDFPSPPSYIIVPSPTQSLEWHVWSSSSGNNCHAVHRSLCSGASVPWDFTLSHIVSQAHLRDFFS